MTVIGAVCLLLLTAGQAAAAPTSLPAGFEEVTTAAFGRAVIATPTEVAWTPDGRMLITDKDGRLAVMTAGGPQVVLDLRARVNNYRDRGLLGLAVDRDFATNGWVYLLYTVEPDPLNPDGGGPTVSRLTRITLNNDNTVANPSSPETVILGKSPSIPCPPAANDVDCIPADYDWHTIGTVRVDPVDGTLWVGSGDAIYSYVVQEKVFEVQDDHSYRGKILHVGRDGRGLPGHPFCPGNANYDDACTKVYAKGFRNPFRFSVRPGKGPVTGDVGADDWEEINLLKPGGNYGWPCYEGAARQTVHRETPRCQALYGQEGTAQAATPPSYAYPHAGEGASAVGGPVYAGTNYPSSYQGDAFVADYARGWVKRMKLGASGDTVVSVENFASYSAGAMPTFVGLHQSPAGNIAYLDMGWGYTPWDGGYVKEFRYSPGNASPVARATGTPREGPAPLTVSFDASASTDADGDTLTFDWDFGDGTDPPPGANATASHTYTTPGTYTARVTVSDGRGGSAEATVGPITPGNTAPVPTIVTPGHGSTFRYGEPITLTGAATDEQDGPIPSSSLTWSVQQQHGNHKHDFTSMVGAVRTFNPGNDHGLDSHLLITLSARDSHGLTGSRTIRIDPEGVGLTLASTPPGAPVNYGPVLLTAPVTRQAAIGFLTEIGAAQTFHKDGTGYVFEGWSDGGARQHQVTIPAAPTTLTASYNGLPTARAAAARATGALPLTVRFDASASSDPDGDPLSFDWDFGDGVDPPAGPDPRPAHTYAAPGRYTPRLTVTDGRVGGVHAIELAPIAVGPTTPAPGPAPAPAPGPAPAPPAAPPDPGPPGDEPPSQPPDPPQRPGRAVLRAPKPGLRLARDGRVALKLVNPDPYTWRGTVELATAGRIPTKTGRKKRLTLGRASLGIRPGAARTAKVRVSAANRRRLAGRSRVRVTITVKPRGGKATRAGTATLLPRTQR